MKRLISIFLAALLLAGGATRAAVEFDGTDDSCSFSDINVGDTHTVSFWIYPETKALSFISVLTYGDLMGVYLRGTAAGGDAWKISYFFAGNTQATTALTLDAWNHVAITRSGTGTAFFVDGVASGTGTVGSPADMSFNVLSVSSSPFDGWLSEVQIFNRVLSSAEIAILSSSRTKGPKFSGLIHYWPLDDQPDGTSCDGDTFLDRAGSANATGNDGANNTGLTARAETHLSYP